MEKETTFDISSLKSAFEESSKIYQEAIDQLNNPDRNLDLKNYINHLFLIRFRCNFKAIGELLGLYQGNQYFKIPIYLILRTCLSDLLTYLYFFHIIKENFPDTKKINSIIYSYLVDHLYREKNDLEYKLKKDSITKEEYDNTLDIMIKLFPDFFVNEYCLIRKNTPSLSAIYNILKENKKNSWAANAYDYYNYFSKFEHVGVFTNEFQEFHKLQNDFDRDGMLLSFGLLFDVINSIVRSLEDMCLNKKLKILVDTIQKI